jgi:DNA-binding transcriptional ArsR family regulator
MLGLTGSNLSFHLKELTQANLVSAERDGRQLFYRPHLSAMNGLVGYLVDHCCQGQGCAEAPQSALSCGPAC